MGSHSKKHKKTQRRSRSRSRSRSSERRHHKSRQRSRSRSISRSGSDSSRSDRRSKAKKHRRRSPSRSRSRSRSRSSLDRNRSRRSRSRSKERDRHSSHASGRRRRSRSVSRSKRRSRSRSKTPSKSRRRSRSRSVSMERSTHGCSHSRHDSREKAKSKDLQVDRHMLMPAETVKQKMQKAIKAAASASDKLKEKGVILDSVKQEPLSIAEEREKQQAIAEIEDDSFKPSTFLSGQGTARAAPAKLSKEQNHDNAIFGSAAAGLNRSSFKRNQTIFYKTVNRGELASSLLAKSSEDKMEAWMEKLARMRQEKIQGNPEYFKKLLTIGTASDDPWSLRE